MIDVDLFLRRLDLFSFRQHIESVKISLLTKPDAAKVPEVLIHFFLLKIENSCLGGHALGRPRSNAFNLIRTLLISTSTPFVTCVSPTFLELYSDTRQYAETHLNSDLSHFYFFIYIIFTSFQVFPVGCQHCSRRLLVPSINLFLCGCFSTSIRIRY